MSWLYGALAALLLATTSAPAAEAGAFRRLASLRQPLGALELGLGAAAQPWVQESASLGLNPAALGRGTGWHLGLDHQFGLLGGGLDSIGLSFHSDGGWGHALGYQHASLGRFERRDALGNLSGGVLDPWGMGARYGLGRSWKKSGLAAGLMLGYLQQTLDQSSDSLFEAGASVEWKPRASVAVALSLKSVGSGLEGATSGAWEAWGQEGHSLRGAVQLGWAESGPISPGLGLVYGWRERIIARAGLEVPAADGFRAAPGLSLGLGIRAGSFSVDAAWKDLGELGALQSLGVSQRWGGPSQTEDGAAKGRELARLGKTKEALWAYHKHLQSRPSDKRAWLDMAKLYQGLGRSADARVCIEKVLALDPKDEGALELLANP